MRTRLEILTKLQPKLFAVGTSTYFTVTRINSQISDSYLTVANARQWPDIKKGFVTSTVSGQDYYDYPSNCQSESVFKISIDGESDYDKLDFEDFMKIAEDTPNSTQKIFSEYGRQLFIFPTPTTNGTSNLILWGVIQAALLTGDSDITMFTDWCDSLNDAIEQDAYSNLIQNIDPNKSLTALDKSEKIIGREYKKIADRLQRKLKDQVQFEVPDYFGSSSGNIGGFSR